MIDEILVKKELDKNDIITLLQIDDKNDMLLLYQKADEVRKQYCGDEVHLRGIIEFSNYCEQDCLYCGLRKSNSSLIRFRIKKMKFLKLLK